MINMFYQLINHVNACLQYRYYIRGCNATAISPTVCDTTLKKKKVLELHDQRKETGCISIKNVLGWHYNKQINVHLNYKCFI